MNDEDGLRRLLRSAMPPADDSPPRRDVWPSVLERRTTSSVWRWLDVGVAAAVAIALWMFPGFFLLLLYHL